MPYCPECEVEYEAGTEICPECATPLVDVLPEQHQYICDECKTPLAEETPWCPECGTVFVETLRCFKHPGTSAYGRCVVCGQHLCEGCAVQQMGRYFCGVDAREEKRTGEKAGVAAEHDWEAVKLRRYLEQASIPSRLVARGDMRRFCTRQDTSGTKLIAPRRFRRQVAGVFAERGIEGTPVAFECEYCSAIFGYEEGLCPNCNAH